MALVKTRKRATGVAYEGVGSRWYLPFGEVIVIAEDVDALIDIFAVLDPDNPFDPGACKQVSLFHTSDTEAA